MTDLTSRACRACNAILPNAAAASCPKCGASQSGDNVTRNLSGHPDPTLTHALGASGGLTSRLDPAAARKLMNDAAPAKPVPAKISPLLLWSGAGALLVLVSAAVTLLVLRAGPLGKPHEDFVEAQTLTWTTYAVDARPGKTVSISADKGFRVRIDREVFLVDANTPAALPDLKSGAIIDIKAVDEPTQVRIAY